MRASSSPRRSPSAEIEELYADRIVDDETLQWSEREGAVLARRQRRLGALVLEDKPLAKPDAEKLKAAMLDGVRQLGLAALPWNDDLAEWRERVAFLRRRTRAGPTCRTQPCSPRSRPGWRRSSTASRGAVIWRGSISARR